MKEDTLFAKYLHTVYHNDIFLSNQYNYSRSTDMSKLHIVNRGRYSLLKHRVKSRKYTRIFNRDFDIFQYYHNFHTPRVKYRF